VGERDLSGVATRVVGRMEGSTKYRRNLYLFVNAVIILATPNCSQDAILEAKRWK